MLKLNLDGGTNRASPQLGINNTDTNTSLSLIGGLSHHRYVPVYDFNYVTSLSLLLHALSYVSYLQSFKLNQTLKLTLNFSTFVCPASHLCIPVGQKAALIM